MARPEKWADSRDLDLGGQRASRRTDGMEWGSLLAAGTLHVWKVGNGWVLNCLQEGDLPYTLQAASLSRKTGSSPKG